MTDTTPDSVTFACPSCGSELEAEASSAGRISQCPSCGASMEIPAPPPETAGGNAEHTPRVRSDSDSPPITRNRSRSSHASTLGRKPKKRKGPLGIILLFLALGAAGGGAWWYLTQTPATSSEQTTSSPLGQPLQSPGAAARSAPGDSAPVQPVVGAGSSPVAAATDWNVQERASVTAFQFGGGGRDTIVDIQARADGRLVVAGTSTSPDGIPDAAGKVHRLIDTGSGETYAFLAELSPDGNTIHWFSLFGGDLVKPTRIALGPDGSIALGGRHLSRLPQALGKPADDFKGRDSLVAKISADGSRVEWAQPGGPNQSDVTGIAVDPQGRIYWTAGTRGRGNAAYILRRAPDGGEAHFPGDRWAIYFHLTTDEFKQPGQVGAFYDLSEQAPDGYYDYDGPGGWAPVNYNIHGMRQGGQIIFLPDGDFVVSGTLQYDFRVKGDKWYPAFDLIVARYSPEGRLKWSTNLYQEGDSIHTPDQKASDMAYNPVTGDLYVLATQHGSNVYRFKGTLRGDTGNLMISWLGQVDAETGALKNGFYWMNNYHGTYTDSGEAASPPHPKLAGNRLERVAVDGQGRVYVAGAAGANAWTTDTAWRDWPAGKNGGGMGALLVLPSTLDQQIYATMIRGENAMGDTDINGLAVTPSGVWIGGRNADAGFTAGDAPAWSNSNTQGEADAALLNFRFD